MFIGTYNHTIDSKGRTSLPARLREQLVADGESKIVLTAFPHWRAIQAWPMSEWKRLEEKVKQLSPLDYIAQKNVLRFFSTAQEVDLDDHGRVLVPPALRNYAAFSKDVVWVGMGRTIQLWDQAMHEASMAAEMPAHEILDFFK